MLEFKKAGLPDLLKIQKIAYETWPNTFGQVITKGQIDYMLELIYNEKYGFKNIGTETTDIGNNYSILDNIMVKEL